MTLSNVCKALKGHQYKNIITKTQKNAGYDLKDMQTQRSGLTLKAKADTAISSLADMKNKEGPATLMLQIINLTWFDVFLLQLTNEFITGLLVKVIE